MAGLQIEDLHLFRLDAPMFERGQQAVMGGGNKRHRNALADQILRAFDVIFHHQRFGAAELRGDEEHFDGEFLAGGHRQWAGTDIADLHIAGGQRAQHAGAAVELTPVDGRAGLFGEAVFRLRHLGRLRRRLVRHGHVHRVGAGRAERQRQQRRVA